MSSLQPKKGQGDLRCCLNLACAIASSKLSWFATSPATSKSWDWQSIGFKCFNKTCFFLHEVNPISYEGPGPLPSSALTKSSNRLVALYLFLGTVACSLLQVANLRVKGSMQGDGAHMNFKKLYYISCHTLENAETVKYGRARLTRDLIDLWVDSKISFGGLEFKSDEPALSQSAAKFEISAFLFAKNTLPQQVKFQDFFFLLDFFLSKEKDDIECYKFLDSPDTMELQVLVRAGSEFKIHPDQAKQWNQVGGTFAQEPLVSTSIK